MLKDLLRYRVDARRVGAVLFALFLLLMGAAYMVNRTFTLTFWDRGYELKADFTDADGIANASDVRIAGVYVGQVTAITPRPGGLAEVTFRVDAAHSPLPRGSRVDLRLQTLLGTKFLDILPGPRGAGTVANGDTLPVTSTTSPVDFDQVLRSFDDPTRKAIQGLIQNAAPAVAGRGDDIHALLTDLHDLSVQSGPDLQTFTDRSTNLDGLLVGLGDVASNLADNRQHLANVQTNLNSVLATLAANDAGFRGFMENGNASLGHGLAQVGGDHAAIAGTVAGFRSTLDRLNPFLVEVTDIARVEAQAIHLSATLGPHIDSATAGYTHDPEAGCTPTPGCGGFYLRQFPDLANAPADQEHAPKTGAGPAKPAGTAVGRPNVPGTDLLPPLSGIPGLPSLIPGTFGRPNSQAWDRLTPAEQQFVADALMAYLLGG